MWILKPFSSKLMHGQPGFKDCLSGLKRTMDYKEEE